MTLQRLEVKDRDCDDYPTYWGIVEKDGKLLVAIVEADDFDAAEKELLAATAGENVEPKAVVRFTHPAYNHPAAARQYAVDLMLEEASRVLGIPPAERGPES